MLVWYVVYVQIPLSHCNNGVNIIHQLRSEFVQGADKEVNPLMGKEDAEHIEEDAKTIDWM